jgi:hypothetical protein
MANIEHKRIDGIHPTNDDIIEAIDYANNNHCSVIIDYQLHNRLCSLLIEEGDLLEEVLTRQFKSLS